MPHAATDVIDVLDRVLDKGVRIDASMRVSWAGIDLIGVEAHVTVASIDTYLAIAGGNCPRCGGRLKRSEVVICWEGWDHPDLMCVAGCHVPWATRVAWRAAYAADDLEGQRLALARLNPPA